MTRLIALALACCPALALAAAPAFLPVQARLVDTSGTPIEAPTNVTFSLYTMQSGGSAVYSEVRAIDPLDGYFAVFLGEVTPLDWSLVQGTSQLFIGIEIANGGEMTRQPIGTVPFSAFADYAANSGTVEDLDVDGIIAEVVSTYPAIDDPYVDSDAVAAMGSLADSNSLNHDRYTDSDAVSAMGALSDSNGLNHDRYTDSDALAAAGPIGDANPHHHDRYTDSDALAAAGSQGNTNPRYHTRYADAEALAAAGGLATSNPRNHTRYADSEALAAAGSQGNTNPRNHTRYADSEALAAAGSQGNSNPRNHSRYADSDALAAAGGLSDTNPRNHDRYSDTEARATVASQDIYLRNTSDVLSGNLEITGSLTTNESPLAMYPTMMSFYRAGNGDIIYTAPDGANYTVAVGNGSASAGLGATSKVAFAPGDGTTTFGKLYFNLNGIPSYACTLLHNEDDSIRHGFGFATDGGNGYASIWGGSTNTKTFVLEREGVAGVPISVNQSFRIICF